MKYIKLILVIFILEIFTISSALCLNPIRSSNPDNAQLSNWYDQAVSNIQEMEYNVSWQETCAIPGGKAGYHIVNRNQNLRLYFYPEGVKIISRTDTQPSWILEWNLMETAGKKDVSFINPCRKAEKNRLVYERHCMTESYENQKDGVKCSLIYKENIGKSDPCVISLKINGNMTLCPALEDPGIDFSYKNKPIVGFKDFHARDSQGKTLQIKTSLNRDVFNIAIDDKEASYPIELNFLVVSLLPWGIESDMEEARFGESVTTAGDVNGDGFSDIVIGALQYDNGQTDEGRIYVFHGSPSGPGLSANWTYESDVENAKLGDSVCTAGDVNGDGFSDIIAGAPYYYNSPSSAGSALVFYGSVSGINGSPVIIQSDATSGQFGNTASTAGDVNGDGYADVIIGAPTYTNSYTKEGKVFCYYGSSGGISTSFSWSIAGGQENAFFGYSISLAGDVNRDGYGDVIIGAPYFNANTDDEGRAYVYLGSGFGLALSPVWRDDGDAKDEYLGYSVSTAGDVNGDGYADIVVGCAGYANSQNLEGAIKVYFGNDSGLSATPDHTFEENRENAYFGNSVCTAGDMDGDGYADVIAGAYYYSRDHFGEGAFYVYRGSKTGLKTFRDWMVESNKPDTYLGYTVFLAGDVNGDGYSDVVVGAPFYDNGQSNEGKCFLYYGNPKTPCLTPEWQLQGSVADSGFAVSASSAGDVNADGLADIMIGAPLMDNGQASEGMVYIYHGMAGDTPFFVPSRVLESNQTNAHFGEALSSAGDINADGYDDIIIGAPGYDNDNGRVYVYQGSGSGIGETADWFYTPSDIGGHFGDSVACAGDVNGDGYLDIIIGASHYKNGSNRGNVYVFHGSSAGLGFEFASRFYGSQGGEYFGRSVATAGDVNRDGFSDVIIGSPLFDNEETDEGCVYVYHGTLAGLHASPDWMYESNQAHANFGESASTAGDVNGDGYSDVIIGAPFYDNGLEDEGAAFIFHGTSEGLYALNHLWMGESNEPDAQFGKSVSIAGDVNGDGFSDVIIGAPEYDSFIVVGDPPFPQNVPDAGFVHIFLGSPTGPSSAPNWGAYAFDEGANLGKCVASAGDVNGDGFSDVLTGAPGYKPVTQIVGRVNLYLGGGGNGRLVKPEQFSSGSGRRVSLLGRTDRNGMDLQGQIINPFGRGKIGGQWDYNPLGTPLGGGFNASIPYHENQFEGPLGISIPVLPENALYHWRMRFTYNPATTPYQSHGPWFHIPWHGMQEADIRVMSPAPSVQDIVDYLLDRGGFPHDTNTDTKTDVADIIHLLLHP
ncbi:FG-GAP repeat protein [Candidatus Sumerlaeota bacterium]|nr:FG-GAP repeat protein [Candidatus Sumerlaeota bacterium]